MLTLYRLLGRIVFLVALVLGKKRSGGLTSSTWADRIFQDVNQSAEIWIHAASVGEITLIGPLLASLNQEKNTRLHLTVMTRTGYSRARELYGDKSGISLFPFDLPQAITQWFDMIRPRVLVIAETEIWPNLILEADRRKVPVILINGRLTDRGFSKYKLVKRTFTKLLSTYTHLFVKTETDRDRFVSLGARPDRVVVAGDMKLDAPLELLTSETRAQIRAELRVDEHACFLVAGSTRPGEEDILLDTYARLSSTHPMLRMAIAPRHLERISEIEKLLNSRGISYTIWPTNRMPDEPNQHTGIHPPVILINSMGKLRALYGAADIAFVGGTLVPIGGHNILEPVWTGTPVLFGPHLSNVEDAAQFILAGNHGSLVENSEQLASAVSDFCEGKRRFSAISQSRTHGRATRLAVSAILKELGNV